MKRKRLITTITAVVLLGAFAVFFTLAYLTSTDTVTNRLSGNNLDILLLEENYKALEARNIVPNQEVSKDPCVLNNSDFDVIVFLEIQSPKYSVQTDPNESSALQELFNYYSNDENAEKFPNEDSENTYNSNWAYFEFKTETDDYVTYLFGYSIKLASGETTETLFDKVKLINYIDGSPRPTSEDIVINAYAVQADDLIDADGNEIEINDTIDVDTLKNIYEIYIKEPEAD